MGKSMKKVAKRGPTQRQVAATPEMCLKTVSPVRLVHSVHLPPLQPEPPQTDVIPNGWHRAVVMKKRHSFGAYRFLACSGSENVFVHASVVERCDMNIWQLIEGRGVLIQFERGPKGLHATAIKLAQ